MQAKVYLFRSYLYIVLIILAGIITYSNTFHAPFTFDDIPNIVENETIKDIRSFWPPKGSRYVGQLTFALNYRTGGIDVFGYHIVNLVVHILNGLLVYWLVSLTFRTHFFQVNSDESNRNAHNSLVAFMISLIFVTHPVQTQAVTYIVQRFTSLATLFYILSFVLYVKARCAMQQSAVGMQNEASIMQNKEGRGQKAETRNPTESCHIRGRERFFTPSALLFYIFSVISAVLAMKTKEIALTLPVVIVLYEFLFFKSPVRRRIAYLMPILITLLVIPFSFIDVDKPIGEVLKDADRMSRVEREGISISRGNYLMTQFRVIITYIRLLFVPINQTLDYDYPVYHSFFEPDVIISFFIITALLAVAFYLVYRSRRTDRLLRFLAFGMLWFFITLSVESSIIPIVHVIFEHRMYLPSVGAIMAFSSLLILILKRWRITEKPIIIIFLLIVVTLSFTAYSRNRIWSSEILLWEDGVKKTFKRIAPYYHLGSAYFKAGRYRDAITVLNIASQLGPDYPQIYFRLGQTYEKLGWARNAVMSYESALRIRYEYPEAHYELGNIYYQEGQLERAIAQFQIALSIKPDYEEAKHNLSVVRTMKKQQGMIDNR
jgi:hypothetical protein